MTRLMLRRRGRCARSSSLRSSMRLCRCRSGRDLGAESAAVVGCRERCERRAMSRKVADSAVEVVAGRERDVVGQVVDLAAVGLVVVDLRDF